MKYLITGANGMLGTALCPILTDSGGEIYPTDINSENSRGTERLDITDKEQARSLFEKIKPDFLFHLAAETNVDKCQLEPEHAYRINAQGTENLALLCKEMDIPMAYISTCGIFDGKKTAPYTELDEPNPVSVYSKTKLEGEKIVKNSLRKFYIFRAGWMMGGSKKDKKFVGKIAELLNTKSEISVVNDTIGNPTYTIDMSRAMVEVIKKQRFGIYHIANKGSCSRYDIACKIREFLGKKDVTIKPVSSADFPLPAPRPPSEAAECLNLKSIGLGDIMRPWEEALEEYLKVLTGNP